MKMERVFMNYVRPSVACMIFVEAFACNICKLRWNICVISVSSGGEFEGNFFINAVSP